MGEGKDEDAKMRRKESVQLGSGARGSIGDLWDARIGNKGMTATREIT